MRIDWLVKLRVFLQVCAFSLTIASLHYVFRPQQSFESPLVYSFCIGTTSWLLIDFGALLFPSARETGWPQGWAGKLLPLGGILMGYVIGTTLADQWFGWSSWSAHSSRDLFASALVSLIIGVVITFYFYSSGKSAYLERKIDETSRLASEARLKLLETQLEPHMLFNTLANLRVLIGVDPHRAQEMLDRMVAYLRATLDASRTSSHTLEREFDRLRDYLELMAVRMGPRMRYTLELPTELAGLSVPTLLLQPLVENSIKHGLEPKLAGGSINVRARQDGAILVLEVNDTGAGFDATATDTNGFGLVQVRERLAATYGGHGQVQRNSTPGEGTSVVLHIPIHP